MTNPEAGVACFVRHGPHLVESAAAGCLEDDIALRDTAGGRDLSRGRVERRPRQYMLCDDRWRAREGIKRFNEAREGGGGAREMTLSPASLAMASAMAPSSRRSSASSLCSAQLSGADCAGCVVVAARERARGGRERGSA